MRVVIVLNPSSGGLASDGVAAGTAQVQAACDASGIEATIMVASGDAVADTVRGVIASGRSDTPLDAVVIGGGDGSVGAAASVLAAGDLAGGTPPLGILPLGTLNHFARDLHLPLEIGAAMRVIARCRTQLVDVGDVNGRIFVNNSSLGIYPHLVAERDRQHRHGIGKWVAAALALVQVLWRLPRPRVRVCAAGWATERHTPCLFIGNNMYELDAFAVARRSRLDAGELCLYIANRQGRLALLALAGRALLGRLQLARDFTLARLASADISARRHRLRVAIDGESLWLRSPLRYRVRPGALRVIVPDTSAP